MLLIYLSCVWIAGIFLGTRLHLPLVLALAGLIPLAGLFFTRRHRQAAVLAGLGIFILVTAAAYADASLYGIGAGKIGFYNDTGAVEVRGSVAAAPDVRDTHTRLTLSTEAVKLEEGWREVGGKVLVFVPRYPEYRYGDVLRVKGPLETPPRLDDFDYRGYLAHQGISATMPYPEISVLATGRGLPPLVWIFSLRARLGQVLGQVLPEPQGAVAQGIVLGIRGNIPADLKADFSRSGTAHLLAISGLHLGIMAGILLGIGLWLFGRRYYLYVWLALGVIWLYTVITGLTPPVVRGAIMATVFLLAEALGRQRSAMVALTLAAAIMVGISPYILGDASFQMSFLAMAGLVFIFPVLRELGRRAVAARLGEEGGLAAAANVAIDTLSATLGAVIAVWPVVAYYFGIVSLVGPVATFLALPALPGIIVTGVLAGVVGIVTLAIAQAIGWVAWLFLSYLLLVVGGLGSPAASSVEVGWMSPVFIWGYYLVLAAAVWFNSRRQRLRGLVAGTAGLMKSGAGLSSGFSRVGRWLVVPLLLLAVLLFYVAATLPDADLHVSFLNVGEGDAVLIQRGSRQVLVDGGPSPQAIALGLSRRLPFWDRSIDLLVSTHPHQDHLAGLVEVLRRYRVERVLSPELDYASPMYDEWRRVIKEKGTETTLARAGQRITLGEGVFIDVLNPPPELMSGTASDIDNNGVVLRVSDGRVSFILTSDIQREAERALVRERAGIAGTVLKVAHHGSDTSSSPGFLAVVSPRVAVISVGADNRFGHPAPDVVSRLEDRIGKGNVYRTDERGAVDFVTDGQRLWVEAGK
ncbi:MAG: DNA internalization-related competence protein ComEC/Rec2 [Chloroflexi bacterium RBG_16_58_8]|nr:MAG: DNA internalization-related competence protein ComEC/Rec2 [Chloroflexi bacterium RBG_16_58_8]